MPDEPPKKFELPLFKADQKTPMFEIAEQELEPMEMPISDLHFMEPSFVTTPADPAQSLQQEIDNEILKESMGFQSWESVSVGIGNVAAIRKLELYGEEGKEWRFPPRIQWEPLEECGRMDDLG